MSEDILWHYGNAGGLITLAGYIIKQILNGNRARKDLALYAKVDAVEKRLDEMVSEMRQVNQNLLDLAKRR